MPEVELLPSPRVVWPIADRGDHAHGLSVLFLDPHYYGGDYGAALKGYWHTGVDLNGPATHGSDTDLGQSVYAIADGVVEFAGLGSGLWGNVILCRHNIGGKVRWSRYGHVIDLQVGAGDHVTAGQHIAGIGKGAITPSYPKGCYPAHLHFDVLHTRPARPDHWPARGAGQAAVTTYYQNPLVFFQATGAVEPV